MDLNLTLIGQMITFAIFIWFTMKFIWPPILKAMKEREKKIADGIANAEKASRELELAHYKSKEIMRDAKLQAAHLIEQANQRANRLVEEAKEAARKEQQIILERASQEVAQAYQQAQEKLQTQLVELASEMATKMLEKHLDEKSQQQLLDRLVTEV